MIHIKCLHSSLQLSRNFEICQKKNLYLQPFLKRYTEFLVNLFLYSGNSSTAESETEKERISKETSLLLQHSKLKKIAESIQVSEKEKRMKEEEGLLQSVQENTALMGAAELAKGIQYVDPIKTSWRPPRCIESLPQEYHDKYVVVLFSFFNNIL